MGQNGSFNLLTSKFISVPLPSAVTKVVEVAVNVAVSREGLISLSHSPGAAVRFVKGIIGLAKEQDEFVTFGGCMVSRHP